MLKNWKVQEIGGAVALLICGLVLLLMPELTLVTIANVIGILVIIIGAFFLIGYFLRKELAAGNNDLIKGLVIVCIGIFICVKSELVVSVLPVVLGIGVVLSGILKLQHAFDLKRMGFDTPILHSSNYREKFKEQLKYQFPRIPYPKNGYLVTDLEDLIHFM